MYKHMCMKSCTCMYKVHVHVSVCMTFNIHSKSTYLYIVCMYLYNVDQCLQYSCTHLTKNTCTCRLELQVSSLEKETESKQQALLKAESQLTDLQTKYEATPKQEVVDRLREDLKLVTEELHQTKSSLSE